MEKLAFAPLIDLPLAGTTWLVLIWYFNQSLSRCEWDTNVDIASRLPTARLRVTVLIGLLLLLCWFLNLAFWSFFGIILGLGFLVAMLGGGAVEASPFGLLVAAYVIREWAFGFPQLILHPERESSRSPRRHQVSNSLVGKTGVTTSPLRPTGDANIEGVKHTVISFDGCFVDENTAITVTAYRNGLPCVTPVTPVTPVAAVEPSDENL